MDSLYILQKALFCLCIYFFCLTLIKAYETKTKKS